MMRLHCFYNIFACAELLENASADFDMRSDHLMIERLAQVVEKGTCFCDGHVCSDFFRNHSGDVCHFDRVLKNILSVACSEMKTTKDEKNARIKSDDSAFVCCLLSFFFYNFIDRSLCIGNDFF